MSEGKEIAKLIPAEVIEAIDTGGNVPERVREILATLFMLQRIDLFTLNEASAGYAGNLQ